MKPTRLNLLGAASVFLCAASYVQAQTLTKANNTDALNTATAWVENVIPGATDNLLWNNIVTSAGLFSFGNGQFAGGVTIVDPGGTVSLRVASNGTTTWANNALIDMSSADLVDAAWTGGTLRIDSANYSPTITVAAGRTLTIGGNGVVNRANTKTLTMAGAGNIVINSNSGGGGAMNFNITGPTVTMNNATSGWTYGTVTSGKLVLLTGTVMSGKSLYMNSANGLEFGTGVTTVDLGALAGNGTFSLVNADTTPVALTFGSNNTNQTFSGAISGAGSLTKVGTGQQIFTGTNSGYTGNTEIQGGEVRLNGEFATLGSGTVTLTNGALLTMHRGDATDNLAYATTFANTLVIPFGQTGTVYSMPRGTWSGALTGSGTLNLRVNATRGDFTGDWSAFGGQINVTARTGNDDWRISNYDGTMNLALAAVDLASGVNLYMINHFYGTKTMQIGTLSGAGNISSGSDVAGRFGIFEVGARNENSTYSGVISDSTGAAALTKVGTGILTLNGANTYTGKTTVSAGTLSVSNPYLADTSTVEVKVTNGAVLNLNFSGGDLVTSFEIDGAAQADGIYGAPGSALPVIATPAISGSGLLYVNTALPGGGYGTWSSTNAGGQTPNLDFDNDGVSNGVEYFMNAPAGFTANPVLNGSNTVTWTNGGNIPSSAYGTQFVVQTSTNLVNWTDVPVGNVVNTGGSVSYTLSGPGKQFARLAVMPY